MTQISSHPIWTKRPPRFVWTPWSLMIAATFVPNAHRKDDKAKYEKSRVKAKEINQIPVGPIRFRIEKRGRVGWLTVAARPHSAAADNRYASKTNLLRLNSRVGRSITPSFYSPNPNGMLFVPHEHKTAMTVYRSSVSEPDGPLTTRLSVQTFFNLRQQFAPSRVCGDQAWLIPFPFHQKAFTRKGHGGIRRR